MRKFTKQDIEELSRNLGDPNWFTHGERVDVLPCLFLAAGLTAEGAAKPRMVHCWLGEDNGTRMLFVGDTRPDQRLLQEPYNDQPNIRYSSTTWTHGTFVPDGEDLTGEKVWGWLVPRYYSDGRPLFTTEPPGAPEYRKIAIPGYFIPAAK